MAIVLKNEMGYMPMPSFAGNSGGNNQNSGVLITVENGAYKVVTPYNARFVDNLKAAIPAIGRSWDKPTKAWFVSPGYGAALVRVIEQSFGFVPVLPHISIESIQESFETILYAEYVGSCNSHNGAASVFANGGWTAKIPEKVLREWFKQTEQNAGSLYAFLGCDEHATSEEIKKAYKRAARQWHPDVCREPNAREMFEQVKAAFDTLSDFEKRRKYNAGLFFERLSQSSRKSAYSTFTPMLRCGLIKCVGKRELSQFIVEKILSWDDIKNESGQTMVSFWSVNSHQIMWV